MCGSGGEAGKALTCGRQRSLERKDENRGKIPFLPEHLVNLSSAVDSELGAFLPSTRPVQFLHFEARHNSH
jgi:hypothetical protein